MVRNQNRFILVLAALGLVAPALGADAPGDRGRIERLERGLMAPCCWSESVYRHSSEVARKMRAEIAEWVAQGKTDREILDTYKKHYGARVLAEPEGSTWWWSVVVPFGAVLLGIGIAVATVRRMRRPRARPAHAFPEGLTLPDVDD